MFPSNAIKLLLTETIYVGDISSVNNLQVTCIIRQLPAPRSSSEIKSSAIMGRRGYKDLPFLSITSFVLQEETVNQVFCLHGLEYLWQRIRTKRSKQILSRKSRFLLTEFPVKSLLSGKKKCLNIHQIRLRWTGVNFWSSRKPIFMYRTITNEPLRLYMTNLM
jgi:hypothetical protein